MRLQGAASGYPQRHWDAVASAWRWARQALLVTGLPALLLTLWVFVWNGPLFPAATAAAVFLVALLITAAGLWDTHRYVRVIPYFERPVGEIDTFLGGAAIARSLQTLDRLAADQGVTPLSALGFADDLEGKMVVWHAPEDGLRTVEGLLIALRLEPPPLPDTQAVLAISHASP